MRNELYSLPFLRLYALTLLFFGANSILNVIVPLRSEALGASNGDIGFIMGAYMFTCMFFRPWAGYAVYRYGAVPVLRTLLLVNGVALCLYIVADLGGYLAARIIQGICTAFFSMALQMGIIDALPEKRRAQGVSLYSLFTYMPTIVGPLLAIGIWEYGGAGGFAAVMIGLAIAAALFGCGVPLQAAGPQRDAAAERPAMMGALRQLSGNRPMLVSSLLMLAASVVFGSVVTFVPLYAKQVAYGNAGVFLMIQTAVIVAVRFGYGSRIPSNGSWPVRFVGSVCLLAAAGAALLSLAPAWGAAALYAAPLLIGIAQALLYPTLVSYLSFVLPGASRPVFIGLFIAMADLGVALGGMAMGPLADRFSYSAMYAAGAALAAASAFLVLLNRAAPAERSTLSKEA